MLLSNMEMEARMEDLKKLLPHRDKIGYIAARNYRILEDNLTEYHKFKDDLIREYGTELVDDKGEKTGQVKISEGDDRYEEFIDKLTEYAEIQHNVEPMKLTYEETIGLLSGEEILALDWLLEN